VVELALRLLDLRLGLLILRVLGDRMSGLPESRASCTSACCLRDSTLRLSAASVNRAWS